MLISLYILLVFPRTTYGTVVPPLTRFTQIARAIRDRTADQARPDMAWIRAMDILAGETLHLIASQPRITDPQVDIQLRPFAKALHPSEDGSDLGRTTWFAVHTDRHKDLCAIAVTLGHASRIRLFNLSSKSEGQVPSNFKWLVDWQPQPRFTPDGNLVVLSESVQDAGYRTETRIDTLARSGQRMRLVDTLFRTQTLDWGGVNVVGDTLHIDCLEDPTAFYTCAAEALLRRTETYEFTKGRFRLLAVSRHDKEIRAVDAWIQKAWRATRPTRDQVRFDRAYRSSEMLNDWKCTRIGRHEKRVELTFDDVKVTFDVNESSWIYKVRVVAITRERD